MKNSKLADIIFFFSVFDKYLPAYVASSFPLPLVCHTFSRAALKTFLFVTSFQQLDCDVPFRFLPVSCARFLVNYLNLWFYIFKMKFDSCRHFFKYISSDSSLPWGLHLRSWLLRVLPQLPDALSSFYFSQFCFFPYGCCCFVLKSTHPFFCNV